MLPKWELKRSGTATPLRILAVVQPKLIVFYNRYLLKERQETSTGEFDSPVPSVGNFPNIFQNGKTSSAKKYIPLPFFVDQ